MKHRCYIDDYNIYEEEITIKNLSSRRRELSKERRRVPLIYVPYGILPFKNTALCQNPQFVTGRKDSLCVPWGKKCEILHCWVSKGEKESEWLRSEVHYLVEIESTVAKGVGSISFWKNFWSGFVYAMSEDTELDPIITITSMNHLDRVRRNLSTNIINE